MQELFPRYFAEEEVAVITGGPEAGQAFCGLPFDHLLFTGATPIGRHVLHAAADHLVPVTLELGASRRRSSAAAPISSAAPSVWRWAR
jgi:coniferyl-aldehyde dehydrogenase